MTDWPSLCFQFRILNKFERRWPSVRGSELISSVGPPTVRRNDSLNSARLAVVGPRTCVEVYSARARWAAWRRANEERGWWRVACRYCEAKRGGGGRRAVRTHQTRAVRGTWPTSFALLCRSGAIWIIRLMLHSIYPFNFFLFKKKN